MSIDIYGKRVGGMAIMLGIEHPRSLNMSNANAAALFALLGLPIDGGCGEASVHDVRRAIIKAKALFEKRVDAFTQEPVDEKRFHSGGISKEYLRQRLDDLSATVETLAGMGAVIIYWA